MAHISDRYGLIRTQTNWPHVWPGRQGSLGPIPLADGVNTPLPNTTMLAVRAWLHIVSIQGLFIFPVQVGATLFGGREGREEGGREGGREGRREGGSE